MKLMPRDRSSQYRYTYSPSFHLDLSLFSAAPVRRHPRQKDDNAAPKDAQGLQLSKDSNLMHTAAITTQPATIWV